MCSRRHPRPNRESGIALISVLWVLLLLSTLAASSAYVARTNAVLTHRAADLARAQGAADAAIVDVVRRLSDGQVAHHPPIDGSTQAWEFEGIPVSISISDESGRIDVNAADDDLILAFLESQGLTNDASATLLAALRDRQGIGSGGRSPGMDLLKAPEELRQIASWRSQEIDCWMGSFTVYSGLPGANQRNARPMVLAALQWAQDHHFRDHDWITKAPNASGSLAEQPVLGEILRIRATATLSKNMVATREWLGRLTGDRQRPTLTVRWGHGDVAGDCR
jgi:general secretion pathway protein K